jgi:hypothetical protein
MSAPDTQATQEDAEPTLAEAFGEFSEALVAEEDASESGESASAAPTETEQAKEPATPSQPGDTAPGDKAPGDKAPAQPASQPQAAPVGQPKQPSETQPAALPEHTPLTYKVDGQDRSFEGGFIVPGHGAIITADALPKLQDRLQQADRLVQQNQSLYQRTQAYEKLGGVAGYQKLAADRALLDASATLLLKALGDETTLVALATDPVARQQLIKEIQLTAREAQWTAQNLFRETAAKEQEASQSAWRMQTAIHNAVGSLAQQFDGLTADDVTAVRTYALKMHAALIRPATPDEAREANVAVGAPILDVPMLHTLLADRHALRVEAAELARRHQTDAVENAARAAAAAPTTVVNGNRPSAAPRPGAGKPPVAAPGKTKLDSMSSAELTRAMKSGRIFDMMGDDDE